MTTELIESEHYVTAKKGHAHYDAVREARTELQAIRNGERLVTTMAACGQAEAGLVARRQASASRADLDDFDDEAGVPARPLGRPPRPLPHGHRKDPSVMLRHRSCAVIRPRVDPLTRGDNVAPPPSCPRRPGL